MDIQPGYSVLEIGCGSGIFAGLLAQKLITGKLFATDRSASMINKTANRNREFIERGIVECIHSACPELHFSPATLDAVVAFNVGFFLKDGERELHLIRNWLKPRGRLFVFYQPPSEHHPSGLSEIAANLAGNNFNIVRKLSRNFIPAPACAIIALPFE